jgi:hypothetical protein
VRGNQGHERERGHQEESSGHGSFRRAVWVDREEWFDVIDVEALIVVDQQETVLPPTSFASPEAVLGQSASAYRTDARKVSDDPFSYHNVYPPSITKAAPVM